MAYKTQEEIRSLKRRYTEGTRIRLLDMKNRQAPPTGTLGTVIRVDSIGNILMKWDTGGSLSIIPGVDPFETIR